jgi:hypothetical protein
MITQAERRAVLTDRSGRVVPIRFTMKNPDGEQHAVAVAMVLHRRPDALVRSGITVMGGCIER